MKKGLAILTVFICASFAQAQCATCGTAVKAARTPLLARFHDRRADRLDARATYHANRAATISSRRTTVIIAQPAEKIAEPKKK